ncbi:MAG: hypothetical protein R3C70_16290 [Geminicoccaceae bacterium]
MTASTRLSAVVSPHFLIVQMVSSEREKLQGRSVFGFGFGRLRHRLRIALNMFDDFLHRADAGTATDPATEPAIDAARVSRARLRSRLMAGLFLQCIAKADVHSRKPLLQGTSANGSPPASSIVACTCPTKLNHSNRHLSRHRMR